MPRPAAFLDSSVIIAALLSSKGGSSYLLTQLNDRANFQINEYVFAEVRGILEAKFADRPEMSAHLFLLLGLAGVATVANPSKQEIRRLSKLISKNDAPILASAMEHSEYLITLDKEFLKPSIVAAARGKNLSIVRPGDFISLFR